MAEDTSLFSISCDTCAARLKVRDQAAIGQVLACPKCGSMLMVQPPDGWEAPVPATTEPPPRRPRDLNDSQATLSGEFSDLTDPTRTAQPAARRVAIGQTAVKAPEIAPASDRPVLPDASWNSAAAQGRSQRIAWISAISGLCLIALVAIIYMATSLTGGNTQTAGGDPDNNKELVDDNRQPENPVDADNNNPPADADVDEPDQPNDSDNGLPDKDNDADTTAPADDKTANDGSSPDSADVVGPDSSADPPEVSTDTSSGDPDAPIVDIDKSLTDSGKPFSLDDTDTGSTLMDEVGEWGNLLADPGVDLEALRDIGSDSGDPPIGIGKVYVPQPDALEIDFDRQLAETFPGVSFEDVKLIVFLRHLNVLTGIPIQLDSHSIAYGHIDPATPVSFKGTNKSVLDIINIAVGDLDLVAIAVPDRQVIVVTDKNQNVFAETTISLDPSLVGEADENEQLVKLVQLVTGPGLWNTDGGQARLEIVGDKAIIEADGKLTDEVRLVFQKLGAASRLNLNGQNPDTLEILQSRWSATWETLDTADAFEQNQLDSIQHILNQVHATDALMVVVDWESLIPEGWTPSTRVPWPSRELTVGETLSDISRSMDLRTRILAPDVVELTSRTKFGDATQIEVYPCQKQIKKFTPEQVLKYLYANLERDMRGGTWKRVEFVPRFGCIIARLPDPLQRRVEKTLAELGRN